jgi:hypothetical protein
VQRYWTPRGEAFRIRPGPDGACPYLNDENLCSIHLRDGPQAKPLACRLFPVSFVRTPEGFTVPLRYSCPAVAAGVGEPLADQEETLEALAGEMGDVAPIAAVRDPLPFDAGRTIPFGDAKEILAGLLRVIEGSNAPVLHRLAAGVEFVDLVAVSSLTADSRFRYWGGLRDGLKARYSESPLVPPAPPSGIERLFFRQAAFGLAAVSNPATLHAGPLRTILQRGKRAFRGLLYMFGKGRLGRAPFCAAVDAALARAESRPASSPLFRFFRDQLATHAHFANPHEASPWLDGFQTLSFALPFALWFARAASGSDALGFPQVVEGIVRLADAMSTPVVYARLGGGGPAWVLHRPGSWLKLLAWATGTEPGEPVRLPA